MEQFLQGTAVVQTAAYFGHQGLGNVKGEAAPWKATVKDVAEVLLPGKTGGAAWAHTGTAPQAQGAEGRGPEGVSLLLPPALDIGRGLRFRLHDVWMSSDTHACQGKNCYRWDKKTCGKTKAKNP